MLGTAPATVAAYCIFVWIKMPPPTLAYTPGSSLQHHSLSLLSHAAIPLLSLPQRHSPPLSSVRNPNPSFVITFHPTMSGIWGSLSKGTASSSASGQEKSQVPLIDCLNCGIPVVRIRSKQIESYGKVYYKCENNIRVSWFKCLCLA
uniref:Uncharacterized protein n=1 Tax=Arundo donax TaxID=35708 RepID=A0A0A9CFI2_ARUDO